MNMNGPLYENLESWAVAQGSSADAFIQEVIEKFYPKAANDPRLYRFFEDANLDALKRHQIAFMRGLFSGKEAGGFTSQQIHEIHKRLILDKGLKDIHFDYFVEIFMNTLREMDVKNVLASQIHDHLAPFREVFAKALSLYTTGREERLFYALDEDADGLLPEQNFRDILQKSGLSESDERLSELFSNLDRNGGAQLDCDKFIEIIGTAGLLVEQALRGELAIPDFREFTENIDRIFDEVSKNVSGKQADYIPPLAEANPDKFGFAIVTVDGQIYKKGDANLDFSIQSMCKPLNYCFAMEELGADEVHRHVGTEPSGRAFNNRDLMARLFSNRADGEAEKVEIPFNPMINAGAIMTAALVKSKEPYEVRLRHVREEWGRLIGRKVDDSGSIPLPRFNKEMARQENYTGYNNLALGYLLMATGLLPHEPTSIPPDTHASDPDNYEFLFEPAVVNALKLYFSTCAIELTAAEVAMAAATISNGGVCPTTQERVFQQSTVRRCLSVTQMCGMYDGSGDFFYNIGLPAKSGVGGGVFLVVPKLMGICIFSPRLDEQGNSARGVEMAKRLIEEFRLHAYDGVMTDGKRVDPRVPVARWRAVQSSEALWAASKGDIRTLQRLHAEQYNLESGDYDGRTPMHLASAEGHRDVVEFLLECGVSPKPDRWGGYPIEDGRNGGHHEIVELFEERQLDKGSREHLVENREGLTNRGAKFGDDIAIVELLWAASENDVSGLMRLLAQGVPVYAMDYDDRTALHLAAAEGQLEAVKYLVAHGHPLHVRDRWRATPLDEAIREKRDSVANYLREQIAQAGADVS
jgi:glutaminase